MRGPRGSTVKLAVTRAGQTLPLEFTVERAQVDVHSVAMVKLDGGYRLRAHHRVQRYDRARTSPRASRACAATCAAKPRGVVLDLRNNPGGVLESAVEVADQLLESGVIVTADGRTPAARFTHGGDAGRGVARRAGGGAGERLDRIGGGNPRRRAAGSSPRRVARPAHLRQGIGADRDAAHRRAAPSSSPPRATSRLRAAPSRATASIRTTPSRTSTACRSISTIRACARRWRARDAGVHAALELLKGRKPQGGRPA